MYDVRLTHSLFPPQAAAESAPTTVAGLLAEQARRRGATLALRELSPDGTIGREWDYAGLLREAETIARALAGRHPRGARIAIFAPNLPEWILVQLAAALAGLTLVTLNPSFQPREIRHVLERSGAEGVYFVPVARGRALGPVLDEAIADLPSVKHRIVLTDRDALLAGTPVSELPETGPDDIVLIQFTSGTTGFPKGALLHQKGLLQNTSDVHRRCGVEDGDSMLVMVPLFNTAGCILSVLGGLTRGATLLLAPDYDPALLARVIDRERPASFFGVPTMIVDLIEEARLHDLDLTSPKSILSGGAMVSPELARAARRVFGAPIQIVYGQTEAGPVLTLGWADDREADLLETVGQPLPRIEVAILGADGAPRPLGSDGEICCRGYNLMAGYHDDPAATAAAIDPDGWLHTGDLGAMDGRGYLKVTGRLKDMIIRGGANLFPAEIENVMLEHEAVLEAAVVGVPDERLGERVACFLRPRDGRRPGAAELKRFARERLAPHKTPAYWIWVDEWPLTGTGKIRKFALREAFLEGRHRPIAA
jgi:acyl-CoA synthetase (AMP-forming)/AMP-acid ligase II